MESAFVVQSVANNPMLSLSRGPSQFAESSNHALQRLNVRGLPLIHLCKQLQERIEIRFEWALRQVPPPVVNGLPPILRLVLLEYPFPRDHTISFFVYFQLLRP